jgi:hypothetical protein
MHLDVQHQLRHGGKVLYQQRGWDAIEKVAGGQCPGCRQVMERADLLDLTVPPAHSTPDAALKAFQGARKQARKAAARASLASSSRILLQGLAPVSRVAM